MSGLEGSCVNGIYFFSLSVSMKEWNALFNDDLNTFYWRLYGIGHMVKDNLDSERGNLLPPHGLLCPISSKGSVQHTPQPFLHWLEREIAQWVDHEGSIRRVLASVSEFNVLKPTTHLHIEFWRPALQQVTRVSTSTLWGDRGLPALVGARPFYPFRSPTRARTR